MGSKVNHTTAKGLCSFKILNYDNDSCVRVSGGFGECFSELQKLWQEKINASNVKDKRLELILYCIISQIFKTPPHSAQLNEMNRN